MKVLTISITTYNSDLNFLEKNLNKLYKLIDQIEIIILDDHSENIFFNKLEKLINEKFKKIILKRNEKNLKMAKNTLKASKLATSKYVKRLDSDDFIIIDELKKLLLFLKKESEFDLGVCEWNFTNKIKLKKIKDNTKINLFNGNTIYRTEFIKKFNHPNGVDNFLEDKSIIFNSLTKNDLKMKIIKIPFYVYTSRGSSTSKYIYQKKDEYIKSFSSIIKNIDINNLNNKKNKDILLHQLSRIASFIYLIKYNDFKKQKLAYEWLKDFFEKNNKEMWNKLIVNKELNLKYNYLKLTYLNGKNIFIKIITKILF